MQIKDLLNRRMEIRSFANTIAESIYKVPSEWSIDGATESFVHKSGLKMWINSETSLGVWFGTSIDTDIFNRAEKELIWRTVRAYKRALVDQMVKSIIIPEDV